MQWALVVLDDIFYCSVGNGLDRSSTLGPDIFVCANPQPAERSRPFPTNWAEFLPSFHTIQIQNQNNRPPAGMSYSKQTGGYLRQHRIILSADTASEVRQMLSQKRR